MRWGFVMQVHLVKVRLNAMHCTNVSVIVVKMQTMNGKFTRSHEETEDMTFDVSQLLVLWSAQPNGCRSPRMESLTKDALEQASYVTYSIQPKVDVQKYLLNVVFLTFLRYEIILGTANEL